MKKSEWIQVVIALAALATVGFVGCQTLLLRRQIELENRPFIGVKNVYWWHLPNTNWFGLDFTTQNYGNKPAIESHIRNFRAVIFYIDNTMIEEKIKSRPDFQEQYLQEYVLDERNRLILKLLEILAKHFKDYPDIQKKELEQFINSLTPTLEDEIFFHNGKLLFKIVEINNEMEEYYRRQQILVVPNEPRERKLIQQMNKYGIQDILDGNNLLVIYLSFQYQNIQKSKQYSTCYLGYTDKHFSEHKVILEDGWEKGPLQEFQSWSLEEGWLQKLFNTKPHKENEKNH